MYIGIVGIGGYGTRYVEIVLDAGEQHGVVFSGAIDPMPETSPYVEELKKRHIPIYPSLAKFNEQNKADLIVICSPIHYHAEQGTLAMEHGSHVLCEKPLCATIQEAQTLLNVRNQTGRTFAVGFQWAYDPAFRRLKADVLAGKLGKPNGLYSLVLWPRSTKYFARPWAGRMKTTDGKWVLDSVANNAAAHFLHAMLHLIGPEETTSSFPQELIAELYRANEIETFDTIAMRLVTETGVEVGFYASHAVIEERGPLFRFEFERGTVFYNDPLVPESREKLVLKTHSGRIIDYGTPSHSSLQKLWVVVDSIRNGGAILCPIESALAHTVCVHGAHTSMPEVVLFPARWVHRDRELLWVEGLNETLLSCYQMGMLPSELKVSWARQGKKVYLSKPQ